ncbi:MAG: 30S ribosomal protein S2 [Verrucomicrobiota bacterium]|nr:30S ribosomal protein S2 [Verrucomicrobiota bacterium]
MAKIDVKDLLEAGVHFGHQTRRWHPKMKPYIFEERNGIYIINLEQTTQQLDAACQFLKSIVKDGGEVLFVGTKKQAQEAVREAAAKANAFYVVERWLGGMLTNLPTIRKSVKRMEYIDAMEKDGTINYINKKEQSAFRRENEKLHRNLDGIRQMEKFPQAVVIVDLNKEDIAVKEARRLKIPVVAIADTNVDPELVDFPVAGNDDAIRAIKIVINALADAMAEARAMYPKASGGRNKEKNEAPKETSYATEGDAVGVSA